MSHRASNTIERKEEDYYKSYRDFALHRRKKCEK